MKVIAWVVGGFLVGAILVAAVLTWGECRAAGHSRSYCAFLVIR